MESPETRDRKKISIFWKRQRWRLSQCFKKYQYHKQIKLLFIIDSIFCTFKRDLEGNGVYWITRNRFMCTSCCFRERKKIHLVSIGRIFRCTGSIEYSDSSGIFFVLLTISGTSLEARKLQSDIPSHLKNEVTGKPSWSSPSYSGRDIG